MATDVVTGRVWLFGGFGATGARDDLWVWDGQSWTDLHAGAAAGGVA